MSAARKAPRHAGMPGHQTIEQFENSHFVQQKMQRLMDGQSPVRRQVGQPHSGTRLQRPQASPASQALARAEEARARSRNAALNREINRVVQNGRPLRVSADEIQALGLTDSELGVLRMPMPERGTGNALYFYRKAFDARKKVRDYRLRVQAARDLQAQAARNLVALGRPRHT